MARGSYALLGILLIGQAGCTQRLTSQWADSPVEVDGDGREWAEAAIYHFEDEPYLFSIQNDAQTLFLLFSTSSRPLIQTLRRVGLTVWLDETGDEEKHRGARIWLAGGGSLESPAGPSDRGPGDLGEPAQPYRAPVFPRPTVVAVGDAAALAPPIRVAQSVYRGVLSVEVEMPLATAIAGSRAISLGFELPATQRKPERMQGRKAKGRMGGGGMGGVGMAGTGGEGMGGGMGGEGMGSGMGSGMGGGMGSGMGSGMGGGMGGEGHRGRGRTKRQPVPLGPRQPELKLTWVTVDIPPPTASMRR